MHRSLPAAAAAPQRTLLKTTPVFQKPSRRSGFVRDVKKNFRFLLFFFPNWQIVPLGGIFKNRAYFQKPYRVSGLTAGDTPLILFTVAFFYYRQYRPAVFCYRRKGGASFAAAGCSRPVSFWNRASPVVREKDGATLPLSKIAPSVTKRGGLAPHRKRGGKLCGDLFAVRYIEQKYTHINSQSSTALVHVLAPYWSRVF